MKMINEFSRRFIRPAALLTLDTQVTTGKQSVTQSLIA